ncbi:tetratricopeptide repeat protein [Fontivita pretiosa]|uniref:tetratricopeptide repeat protein n=1 Tax=Fontivita pretiosa TaxID=2989684 RepID=UPI003D1824F6
MKCKWLGRRSVVLMLVVVLASSLAGGGCSGSGKKFKNKTQREQAQAQWNRTRAAVLASLAKSQYQNANFEQAQQSVNEGLRMDPNLAALHVLNAKIAIEQGQLERAQQSLTVARKLDEKLAEADYLMGVVYQRWQKPQQAYECYLAACQKDPQELAYFLARAEMLVAMNCPSEALSLLQSKVADFEHNAELHHAIGQLLVEQNRYKEAVESLRQASVLATDDLTIREHLAMALFLDRQYREAADIFSRLLQKESHSKRSELWLALGECQMQIGRAGEARASFDTATQLDPSSASGWLSLAKAALQLGDARRAEVSLRKSLAIDPDNPEVYLMFGYLRLREKNLREAMAQFQKAATLDRRDPVALCMIGYVLEQSGRRDQAMKYYAAALKLRPGDELASKLMASAAE